jgi:hypothetical protein
VEEALLLRAPEPNTEVLLLRAPEPRAEALLLRAPEPRVEALLLRAPEPRAEALLLRAPEPRAEALLKGPLVTRTRKISSRVGRAMARNSLRQFSKTRAVSSVNVTNGGGEKKE